MSIGIVRQIRQRGFTLLEVSLSVAILAMVALAIYRFVSANLNAVRISSQENAADARYAGFVSLLASQVQELSGEGGVLGEPYKFSDQSQDEMSWICGPGPGLLTRYAEGEFIVSLRLKRGEKSGKMEVGFMRKPRDTPEGSTEGMSWVPLIEGVTSLQIRYYDPRLPAWVERWTDTRVMPRLVRLVIGRPDRTEPLETIIALARTPLTLMQQMPQMQQPQPGAPGGQPGAPGAPPPPPGPGKNDPPKSEPPKK